MSLRVLADHVEEAKEIAKDVVIPSDNVFTM